MAHVRPTTNRVRETLFNWLQTVIEGANCLDLFAGTGALGFEALSRGAGHVAMVEQNPLLVEEIKQQAGILEAQNLEIIQANAIEWLASTTEKYDIIFIDPPFRENLYSRACELLINKGHLHEKTLIYVEGGSKLNVRFNHFHVVNQSRAGQVKFLLLAQDGGEANNENNRHLSGNL